MSLGYDMFEELKKQAALDNGLEHIEEHASLISPAARASALRYGEADDSVVPGISHYGSGDRGESANFKDVPEVDPGRISGSPASGEKGKGSRYSMEERSDMGMGLESDAAGSDMAVPISRKISPFYTSGGHPHAEKHKPKEFITPKKTDLQTTWIDENPFSPHHEDASIHGHMSHQIPHAFSSYGSGPSTSHHHSSSPLGHEGFKIGSGDSDAKAGEPKKESLLDRILDSVLPGHKDKRADHRPL